MINLFQPCFGQEEIDAVSQVLQSGWIGLGPKTKEFEEKFSNFIKVPYSIGVNSCTTALELALILADVKPGDEILVPTLTFVSTAHAVLYRGATPIFCDVDPHTLLIDLEEIQRKITKKTRAIIPVHYGGHCVDIDAIRSIDPKLTIIEDCAHACGSSFKDKKAGSLGDIGCFSFHAVKNLATGDGGMLTVNTEKLYSRAKKLRWLGINKGTWDRAENDYSYTWEYNIEELGYKWHMNDIIAALGIVQLSKLEKMNSQRMLIQNTYRKELNIPEILLPIEDDQSSWHIFQIQLDDRDKMIRHLEDNDILTGVHYKPIHLYKCYGNQPKLPVAEQVWKKLLSLPMYPNLTISQVRFISKIIKNGKSK